MQACSCGWVLEPSCCLCVKRPTLTLLRTNGLPAAASYRASGDVWDGAIMDHQCLSSSMPKMISVGRAALCDPSVAVMQGIHWSGAELQCFLQRRLSLVSHGNSFTCTHIYIFTFWGDLMETVALGLGEQTIKTYRPCSSMFLLKSRVTEEFVPLCGSKSFYSGKVFGSILWGCLHSGNSINEARYWIRSGPQTQLSAHPKCIR